MFHHFQIVMRWVLVHKYYINWASSSCDGIHFISHHPSFWRAGNCTILWISSPWKVKFLLPSFSSRKLYPYQPRYLEDPWKMCQGSSKGFEERWKLCCRYDHLSSMLMNSNLQEIDNTNRDIQTRRLYIDLARGEKVPIRWKNDGTFIVSFLIFLADALTLLEV